jgi:hypothetical protein
MQQEQQQRRQQAAAAGACILAAGPYLTHAPSPLPPSQFGFIKCSTHEGRYFYHINDSDGATNYGSTVR